MLNRLLKTMQSLWWNKRALRWAALSVFLYHASVVLGQDTAPEIVPIYTYHFNAWEDEQRDYDWLPNNTLSIEDVERHPLTGAESPLSIVYDPYSPRSTTLLSLATPTPRPTHVQMLPPIFRAPFAISPNGRFDLYAVDDYITNETYTNYHREILGLVDRETGGFITFPDIPLPPRRFHDLQWSSGSGAFVLTFLSSYPATPFYIYVGDFGDDISNARTVLIRPWNPTPDIFQFSVYQVYDLDSTGQYLLADGYFHTEPNDPGLMRLVMINMEDLSYDIVSKNKYFTAARFEKPGDQHVFYMSEQGAFAYNREEEARSMLTRAIDAHDTWVGENRISYPSFSPDGHYLVTQLRGEGEDHDPTLYVYPIPSIP